MTRIVGALALEGSATRFVLWAPGHRRVWVHLLEPEQKVELEAGGDGYHEITIECTAGRRYFYQFDDGREYADPASRSQPEGVHGPSEVVDLHAHRWLDGSYRPRPLWDQVIYELHVGTFSARGTFDAVTSELDELAQLGVGAIEIMPVAQFPGERNWGYDGVFPYAVQNSYGGPAGLQRLVEVCHDKGLAVVLDVVYNHLGPEGDVLGAFGPYFTDRYATPWGRAINFDGPDSDEVRSYFIQNACQWFRDFHVDALRLDAVHEIIDRNATTFLTELVRATRELAGELGSPCHLIAESADNDPRLVNTEQAGGFGLDAQWNDDFHHALHTVLTGEKFGYYIDYGSPADLARAMDSGFVYQGEHSVFRRRRHGAASVAIAPERFVIFAQNHDHIGNRPRGDRLASLVSTDRARLVAALVILAPGIPLLFMGEEYGETAPFPYFIDHGDPALIDAVRKGRAAEFSALAQQGQLYDPAARSTFEVARIDRSLRHKGEHASLFELYGDLIALRRQNPALRRSPRAAAHAYIEGGVLIAERTHPEDTVMTLFNLTGDVSAGTLTVETSAQSEHRSARPWHNLLDPDAPVMVEGARVSLEPWGFAVYHLGTEAGGEKGVTR